MSSIGKSKNPHSVKEIADLKWAHRKGIGKLEN